MRLTLSHTTTRIASITSALILAGCGIFVDLDEITYVGPSHRTPPDDMTTDMSVVADITPDEDMDAPDIQCEPLEREQCSNERGCVVRLTTNKPPHVISNIRCRLPSRWGSDTDGDQCDDPKDCELGHVCVQTAGEDRRECVSLCEEDEDCRGGRSCVLHFTEQVGYELGLCE